MVCPCRNIVTARQELYLSEYVIDVLISLFMSLYSSVSTLSRQEPFSPFLCFRIYWDLAMIFILSVNLILLPIVIAFYVDDYGTQWIVINSITDAVFIIDILLNFRTGIVTSECPQDRDNKHLVILDSRIITLQYLKTWFVLDVISAIPFDNISLLFLDRDKNIASLLRASRALRTLRMAKLLSLLRLLRISRLLRYVDTWEDVSFIFKYVGAHVLEESSLRF